MSSHYTKSWQDDENNPKLFFFLKISLKTAEKRNVRSDLKELNVFVCVGCFPFRIYMFIIGLDFRILSAVFLSFVFKKGKKGTAAT